MPGLDRSGPRGSGPMTGGRGGLCGNTECQAHLPPYGGGYGSGYPVSRIDEMEMLRADADAMQKSLEAVQRRITELEKEESQ